MSGHLYATRKLFQESLHEIYSIKAQNIAVARLPLSCVPVIITITLSSVMMSTQASTRKHVVLLGSAVFGHIPPLLQLARKISKVHDVTFILPQLRVRQLRERGLLTEETANIELIGMVDELNENADYDGSIDQLFAMVEAQREQTEILFPLLPCTADPSVTGTAYLQFLDRPLQRPIDVVIGEFIAFFRSDLLMKRGVKCLQFYAFSGLISTNKVDVNQDTPELSDDAFFTDWERYDDCSTTGVPGSYKKVLCEHLERFQWTLKNLSGFIINSVEDLEPRVVEKIQTHRFMSGRPTRFVAPLFGEDAADAMQMDNQQLVLDWLENQKERSVVYVCFGSSALPSDDQISEIAKALLLLDQPFLWSLKSDHHQLLPEQLLPLRANQSASSRSLILPWVPQRRILHHPATRIFVTHCGWNSTLEGLEAGIPLLCWPLLADEFPNSDMVARRGAGLVLPGTGMKFARVVPADEIAGAMQEVGQWNGSFEEGRYAKGAGGTSQMVRAAAGPGGKSCQAVSDLINRDI